ncbi:MAG: hypothetical protein ACRELG_25555 [Gemmataceae bacterium]
MVPPQDILNYLRAEPFRPIRVDMESGKSFDIRHPEMVRVGRNVLILFASVSDDPDIFDRWETVSLMLIENISFVETSAA